MYLDLLQISDGNNKTSGIDNIFGKTKDLKKGEVFIVSAQPAVSKAGKSYYRLAFSDGKDGMLFKLTRKLFPGLKANYKISQPPFIEQLKILE